MRKRNDYIDVLRGIAIILVVIGHCIQYGSGLNYGRNLIFYDNILFKWIYSFHMPLFMLISGYLFYFSEQKYTTKELIKNKFLTIMVPLFSFSTIIAIINIVKHGITGNVLMLFLSFIRIYLEHFWFLWALFLFSIGMILINKIFKNQNKEYIYLIIYIISFVVPDRWVFHVFKYVYPYYIIGYLFNKNKNFKNWCIDKHNIVNCLLINLFFVFLLFFFQKDIYVYNSFHYIFNGNGVIRMIGINLFRNLIGLVGSLAIITTSHLLFQFFSKKQLSFKLINYIGKQSLGIYAISSLIFEFVMQKATQFLDTFNYFYLIGESILVIVICLIIIKILSLNNITNKIFLGGRC